MSQSMGRPAPGDREACVNENYAVGSDAAGGQGTSARSEDSEEQRQTMTHLPLLQKFVYLPKVRSALLVLPALAAFSGTWRGGYNWPGSQSL